MNQKKTRAAVIAAGIGILCLLILTVAVRRATRGALPRHKSAGSPALLYSKCIDLQGKRGPRAVRAAVLFAHHDDGRFSLPMVDGLAAAAKGRSDSTIFVVVTSEPESLISTASGAEDAVSILGGKWLEFAPRAGNKLFLPALTLLREPGEIAFQWVGNLDRETLEEVLKDFSSGIDPQVPIPGEGDPLPQALREALAARRTDGGWGEKHGKTHGGQAVVFVDPSCHACGSFLGYVSSRIASYGLGQVVVVSSSPVEERQPTETGLSPQDSTQHGLPAREVISDPDLVLFSAMRISIVPTLVLTDADARIIARVDGDRERTLLDGIFKRFGALTGVGSNSGSPTKPHGEPMATTAEDDRRPLPDHDMHDASRTSEPDRLRMRTAPIPTGSSEEAVSSEAGVPKAASGIICYFFLSTECAGCGKLLDRLSHWPHLDEFIANASATIVFQDTTCAKGSPPAIPLRGSAVVHDPAYELMASFGVADVPTVVCVAGNGEEVLRWRPEERPRGRTAEPVEVLLRRLEGMIPAELLESTELSPQTKGK